MLVIVKFKFGYYRALHVANDVISRFLGHDFLIAVIYDITRSHSIRILIFNITV